MFQKTNAKVVESLSVDEFFRGAAAFELELYVKSVLNELPDQRVAAVDPQQQYLAKKKLIEKVHAEAAAAATRAAVGVISRHPDAQGFNFEYQGRVTARKYVNVNYKAALLHMLDCILERGNNPTTQAEILSSTKAKLGIHELNANIWKMPLKRYMLGIIKNKFTDRCLAISLVNCKDMSSVRKAVEAHYIKQASSHHAKLDIAFTSAKVLVNGTSYKISANQAGCKQYELIRVVVGGKRVWLRVDALKVLFGIPA